MAMNMEVVNKQANSVDFALQAMAVDSGVNSNSLETLIAVRCETVNHVPTRGGLGMFFLRGSKLLPSSNKTLTERPEVFLGQEGCGYEGCTSSGTDSLQDQLHELPTMVPCSNKTYEHDVVLEDACEEHGEVCSGTLVLSLCKTLCKWLQGRFRRMFNDGCGLAHHTLLVISENIRIIFEQNGFRITKDAQTHCAATKNTATSCVQQYCQILFKGRYSNSL